MLETEADGLCEIAKTRTVKVSEVILSDSDDEHAYLVLEWLDLQPLDRSSGRMLGEKLAALHSAGQAGSFGWETNNFIGTTPQENGAAATWPEFFALRRLEPQLRMAGENGYQLPSAEPVLRRMETFFPGDLPQPCALHGDLWGGNAAATRSGEPVLFDLVYYPGAPETDLAFSRYFGGFPVTFYDAYEKKIPPRPGWHNRQILYNLYHVLNHLNLFGSSYREEARRMIGTLCDLSTGE